MSSSISIANSLLLMILHKWGGSISCEVYMQALSTEGRHTNHDRSIWNCPGNQRHFGGGTHQHKWGDLVGHNNVPLCSDVCSYLVKQLATTRRNSTSSDQVNATLHQVATEQNDTIILLYIEWKEMRPMHQIHNCKLISHMLNPHYRNVCACYNNKIFRIRKCQCYNELCSCGEK